MKKIAAFFLIFTVIFCLSACTKPEAESSNREDERESSSVSHNTSSERPNDGEDNTVDIDDLTNGMQP